MLQNLKIIYGTHKMSTEAITNALKTGYQVLDTATGYNNASFIKSALKDTSKSPIIITKFNPSDFAADIESKIQSHFNELDQNPHIVLLHSPFPTDTENVEAILKLKSIFVSQKIGVSNFDIPRLEKLIVMDLKPDYIQLEYHPFYQPRKLLHFCKKNNIQIMCYRPLAKGKVNDNKIIQKIATKYSVSPAQITLKWLIERGIMPVVSSSNITNMKANLDYDKIKLTMQDLKDLDNLNEGPSGATCMLKYCSHDI